jgi:hypothetical protein
VTAKNAMFSAIPKKTPIDAGSAGFENFTVLLPDGTFSSVESGWKTPVFAAKRRKMRKIKPHCVLF